MNRINRTVVVAAILLACAACDRKPAAPTSVEQPVSVPTLPALVQPEPEIDWSKATDDQRFALLKPVMTYEEVERLWIGKKQDVQACGQAKDDNGNLIGSYDGIFWYKISGRTQGVTMSFTVQDVYRDPNKPRTDTWGAGWGGGRFDLPPSPPKRVKPNLVFFRADGVIYRRNKDGLYVAEPTKK